MSISAIILCAESSLTSRASKPAFAALMSYAAAAIRPAAPRPPPDGPAHPGTAAFGYSSISADDPSWYASLAALSGYDEDAYSTIKAEDADCDTVLTDHSVNQVSAPTSTN